MGLGKVTIMMSKEFVLWWHKRFPPHIKDDQGMMFIAWSSWDEAKRTSKTDELLTALKEIAKGEGAYSRDQLEHCVNAVENMKNLAKQAIKLVEPEKEEADAKI